MKNENYNIILFTVIINIICLLFIYFFLKVSFLVSYYLAINLVTVYSFYNDKRRSIKARWRYPEKFLKQLGCLGGPVGGIIGMKLFHHKTAKNEFYLTYGLSFIVHSVFIFSLIYLNVR